MDTTTTTTTTTIDAALAAIHADHAALAKRVAALTAKADALDALAESTWAHYKTAVLDAKDFDLVRALRAQYRAERATANRARGQISAAYTRHSAKRRDATRAAFLA